MTLLDYLF